jgi:hypothetical protein
MPETAAIVKNLDKNKINIFFPNTQIKFINVERAEHLHRRGPRRHPLRRRATG